MSCKHNEPIYYKCIQISEDYVRKKVLETPDKSIQDRKLSYFYKVKALQGRCKKYKQICRNQNKSSYCVCQQKNKFLTFFWKDYRQLLRLF